MQKVLEALLKWEKQIDNKEIVADLWKAIQEDVRVMKMRHSVFSDICDAANSSINDAMMHGSESFEEEDNRCEVAYCTLMEMSSEIKKIIANTQE